MDIGSVAVVNDYYADETNISFYLNGSYTQATNITLEASESITFTGYCGLDSWSSINKRNVTFSAPKIYMNITGDWGFFIKNDGNNSITFNNSSVNFDNTVYSTDPDYIGRLFFTGTSSLNITSNSNGKTLIHASTLAGTITLEVEDGVQDGDTFLIEATNNQLVITDGEWTATPSTSGNVTTYTLARANTTKTRLVYTPTTDIPANFTEVEYLESTGTQWIDIGTTVNTATDEIDLYFQLEETNNYKWFFGEYDSNNRLGLGSGDGTNKRNFLYKTTVVKINDVDMYNSQHHYSINSSGAFLDSVKKVNYSAFSSTSTLYLFNLNIDSASDYRCKCKVWSYRQKRNGVLIRDMVPCLDASNVPCMFDKVSGQTFYNQGTGSFTYGRKIIPVEYLQSSGTQYIDTGFTPNQDTKVVLDYQISTDLATGFPLFGSRVSASSRGFSYQRYSSNVMGGQYGNNITYSSIEPDLNRHIVIRDKNKIYLDGTQIVSQSTATFTCPGNLYLNAMNNDGTATIQNCSVKYYSMSIYDNGTLVLDYIPCKDENNVGFMFDKVSHTAYLNAGTGDFIVGKTRPKKKLRLIKDSPRRVPVGFKEVEYLESTGTQYIDTGLDYFADFEVGIKLASNATNKALGNGQVYCMQRVAANTPYWQFSSGTNNSWNSQVPITEFHIIKWKEDKIYSDNTFLKDKTKDLNSSNQMMLFGTDASHTYPNLIYFCKMWNPTTGELVRDFIPCLDNNDIPCLWDRVEQKAYYNAGTGSFTYGHTITPVEYLESSGTQYIDLGLKGKNGYDFDYKFNSTRIDSTAYGIGGEWESNKSCYLGLIRNTDKFAYHYQNTQSPVEVQTLTANTDYRVQAHLYSGEQYYIINGTKSAVGTITGTFESTTNMNLFRVNSSSPIYSYIKVYYCKIWDNGVLVRDYIACKDENNVGYMLDTVSHTLYNNAGTGSFTVGAELKDKIRFVKGK